MEHPGSEAGRSPLPLTPSPASRRHGTNIENVIGGSGLIWLLGCDGNDNAPADAQDHTQERQGRMLIRRRDPVRVPGGDRMPPQVFSPYTHGANEAR